MLKINIQSFGDVITNSSSEIYTIYDLNGIEQIESAITNICRVLNPNIDWRDHLTIELSIDDEHWSDEYDDEKRDYLTMRELYEREFNAFCESRSNEKTLKDFPEFYRNFCKNYCTDGDGKPCFDLSIEAKTDIGKTLESSILKILDAFEHVEVYS